MNTMSARIRVLSESLANKIAAGEVVERPASVVKELIENSIDAGATDITVDIQAGGRKHIGVMDNGEGMNRDNALLALERHATSKISQEGDLFQISTMGFRGEALPSIASVSKLRITTKPDGSLGGTRIYCDGGKIKEVSEEGCPVGTAVKVSDLFYNTPARLKFLKTDTTEFGHIVDVVTQTALAYPEIHFKLIHNRRSILNTPATKDLLNRVSELLGGDAYKHLCQVSLCEGPIGIRGLISKPDYSRASGKAMFTYVNRRFIRDRVVNHAVMEAYRTFSMKDRYPVVLLFIDIPAHCVDINVHPTKREVRFTEQKQVHDLIVRTLKASLLQSPWKNERVVSYEEHPSSNEVIQGYRHRVEEAIHRYSFSEKETPIPVQEELVKEESLFYSSLIPLGQINDTYMLCSCSEGLIIIDQHAAHERAVLERLKEGLPFKSSSQGLLIPEQIELGHKEARCLEEYLERLGQVGLEIEPFGDNTFIIKSVPQVLVDKDYHQTVMDIVDELSSFAASLKLEESIEKILTVMACHGAIKANQRLNQKEMEALLELLDSVGSPINCPHGRPILKKITLQEMNRMFKRE